MKQLFLFILLFLLGFHLNGLCQTRKNLILKKSSQKENATSKILQSLMETGSFNSTELNSTQIFIKIATPESEEEGTIFEHLSPSIIKNLPSTLNGQILYFINYYTSPAGRKTLLLWFKRASWFYYYVEKIFRKFGLPKELTYLFILESGGNPYAISRAGAVGLWQFMPRTAKRYGLKIDYFVDERKDFIKSTYAAARYLSYLYNLFNDWKLAVASYNIGEGKILNLLKIKNIASFWGMVVSGKLPLETMTYVPQWIAISFIAQNYLNFEFPDLEKNPVFFDTVYVPGGLDLRVIAFAINVSPQILYLLNPALVKGITPPYAKVYPVRIPPFKKNEFYRNFPRLRLVKVARWIYKRKKIRVRRRKKYYYYWVYRRYKKYYVLTLESLKDKFPNPYLEVKPFLFP